MKALLAVAGFLAGYGLSVVSGIALFQLSGHAPHFAQPFWFMAMTAVYGVAFSIAGGYIATWIGGYGAGFAVGVATFVVAMLSALGDRSHPHWSQVVALVFMCPAAVLGAKLQVRRQAGRRLG